MFPVLSPRAPRRAAAALLLALILGVASLPLAGVALGRDLAVDLSMRYIHQYLGNANDDFDCGPTAVAMVLSAYGLRPAGTSDARFVTAIRSASGAAWGVGTTYDNLIRAVQAYGLSYTLIPSSMPGEPDAEAQAMRQQIEAGNLVVAMIHGGTIGRGERYGDHWVVVAGFNGDSVHLLDPDDQAPRDSAWVRGGDITLPLSVFEQAGLKAQSGPYAMVIMAPGRRGALRTGAAAHITGTDGDGAWLRSGPGIGDNKLTLLPEGTAVTVVGPLPAPNADGHDWIGISVNGQQGYVAAEYVAAN